MGLLQYDPYDVEINADPYPVFRRLREEAPLYYNEQYDFYARQPLRRRRTRPRRPRDVHLRPRRDPRADQGRHRDAAGRRHLRGSARCTPCTAALLSRVFTPKKMNALEPKIREFCAASLDPLVGTGRFDFVADLGAQMPMRVIGMLLGIPEQDQEAIRDHVDAPLRTEAGKPMEYVAATTS